VHTVEGATRCEVELSWVLVIRSEEINYHCKGAASAMKRVNSRDTRKKEMQNDLTFSVDGFWRRLRRPFSSLTTLLDACKTAPLVDPND
jgi:hypothetical protein